MTGSMLIVGAGPRLGAAIGRRLGRDGYAVGLIGRTEAGLAALGDALRADGIECGWACADVADPDALSAALACLIDQVGPAGIAVHNVSVWRDATTATLTPAHLLADVAAGTASLLTLAQAVLPGMVAAGRGLILATGSAAAGNPSPGAPTLGVQKAGLRSLAATMDAEFAPQGVRCASVTINGVIGTPGFEPDAIAEAYAALAARVAADGWASEVTYPG